MDAIFACKLYRASTRKQKIQAALQNPINAELVMQLDEYLKDEYKPVTNIDGNVYETTPKGDTSTDTADNGNNAMPSPHGGSHSSGGGLSAALSGLDDDEPSISEEFGAELDAEGNAAFDATQGASSNDDGADDTSDNSAVASTNVQGKKIIADTSIPTTPINVCTSISGLAGELKGTLNARNSTAGVNRVSAKGDEVWIYYNDDINLNNVMTFVIDVLSAANYHYLVFNRLARTDNAIVFTINSEDTSTAMGSASNEE